MPGFAKTPTGVDALRLERTAHARAEGGRGAHRHQGRQPELSRPADRAEQVPDEAAAAVRARLRIRRRGRRGRRRRHAAEGRRRGRGLIGHRRLRHACRASTARLHAAAGRLRCRGRRGLHLDLRHLAPRADRPRAAARPARPCWCSARPAASARRRSRSPRRPARASSPPRRPTRSARCAATLGADATHQLRHAEPARGDQGADRRQGPRRDLRPGRRRLRRAGVPLDRLARPLPGGRLRRRRDSGAAVEPGAAQGRVDRRRVLGRLRAPRAGGQRRKRWRSWRSGTPRARSSR